MSTTIEQIGPAAIDGEQFVIQRAQEGDHDAFEKLVLKYDRDILHLTLHLLGNRDEARDAYQETFLRAFRSIGRFQRQSSFYTWIFRIATNVCVDRLRQRRNSWQEFSIDSPTRGANGTCFKETLEGVSWYGNPEKSLYASQIGERIGRALDTLSRKERLVFELKHYQGLRLRQIGQMIGSTENTAKNYLYRATQKLRAQLAA